MRTSNVQHPTSNIQWTEPAELTRVVGDRVLPSVELLQRFTKPGHPQFKDLMAVWSYRGDLTESGDRRLEAAMGKERYVHFHWDTIACNGSVILCVERWKDPAAVEYRMGGPSFNAEWYWCFSQIGDNEDVSAVPPREIWNVSDATRTMVESLPDLNWMTIRRVNFYESGSGPARRKSRPAPEGVVFFRFTGGVGLAAAPAKGAQS